MVIDRVVPVGAISTRDLEIWGRGFKCRFLPPTDDLFASLIEQLDQIEATPLRLLVNKSAL